MHYIEFEDILNKNLKDLVLNSAYIGGDSPYMAKNLNKLRTAIEGISEIEIIHPQIEALRKSWLFSKFNDEMPVTSGQESEVNSIVKSLKIGLEFLREYFNKNILFEPNSILIKLPPLKNFEDLAKIANDFKRSIEMPILVDEIGGNVTILSAEKGSIWLTVGLSSISAINLIAAICWSAAVIRKKMAEARIFEAHAKTLDLKNDSLQTIVDAQKIQVNNILNNEAEAISNKFYSSNDPETIERLKLSINTIADLIEKGSKILPNTKDENVKKLFPDYSHLNLIESSIKQLANNKE